MACIKMEWTSRSDERKIRQACESVMLSGCANVAYSHMRDSFLDFVQSYPTNLCKHLSKLLVKQIYTCVKYLSKISNGLG